MIPVFQRCDQIRSFSNQFRGDVAKSSFRLAHIVEIIQDTVNFAWADSGSELRSSIPRPCPKPPLLHSVRLNGGDFYTESCLLDLSSCFGHGSVPGGVARIFIQLSLRLLLFSLSGNESLCFRVKSGSVFFAPNRVTENRVAQNLRGQRMGVLSDVRIDRL